MDSNPDIALKLDLQKVNAILTALGELPFRVSVDLIGDIRQQTQAQLSGNPES